MDPAEDPDFPFALIIKKRQQRELQK